MTMRSTQDSPHFAGRARTSSGRPVARRLAGSSLAPVIPLGSEPAPSTAAAPVAPRPTPTGQPSSVPAAAPLVTPPPTPTATSQRSTTPAAPAQPPSPSTGPTVHAPAGHFSKVVEAPEPAEESLDWNVVRDLRAKVSEAVTNRLPLTRLNREDHGELVTDLTHDALRDLSATSVISGRQKLTEAMRSAYTTAVLDAFFAAGRFQRLMELPGVENIEVEGWDSVTVTFADAPVQHLPPLFSSDEELINEVRELARYSVTGEKDFSEASQTLRMALPDGSRLAAEAWHCRPSVTIRVHRYVDTDLLQLQQLGTLDTCLAQFLAATIRAGFNIIVSGDPAAGKTTLSRGMLNALNPDVRIATIESVYELGLDKLRHRHSRVWAAEAQPGGEPGPDGRPRGEITLARLVSDSLQKNTQRVVVGETTRGDEVAAMLEAMQAAKGCLTTLHASSAGDSLDRLATLLMGVRANTSYEYAARLVAQNVHMAVHLALRQDPSTGVSERYVDEIVAFAPSTERVPPVEFTPIFEPGPDGRARPTGEIPDSWRAPLSGVGFDLNWLLNRISQWGAA